MSDRTHKVRIVTPDNGWDSGIALIKLGLSACNPMPKLEGEQFRSFQPLRPLKAAAVIIGSAVITGGCFGAIRGAIFPAPLAESAPGYQRVGHQIGANYVRPVATGLLVGTKATLATVEADFRRNEGITTKPTQNTRQLTTAELQMLNQFTGKTLLVDFENR